MVLGLDISTSITGYTLIDGDKIFLMVLGTQENIKTSLKR